MDIVNAIDAGLRAAIGPVTIAYAISALGLNLQFGYTGLLNFGHVAFMLMGAYGAAITVENGGSLWLGIVVGILAAVALGLVLGIPTLRLRADYLAITTIAAAEVLRLTVRSSWANPLTGSVFGIQGFADDFFALSPFTSSAVYDIGFISVTGRRIWVIIVGWVLVVLLTLLLARLLGSPWGRLIRAIREDEDAVRSLGKNVFARKLQALTIGGALGAVAGIVLAVEQQNVTPDSFRPEITFIIFAIVILGGAGTVWGPLVGAVVFQFLFFFLDTMMRDAQASVGWVNAILSTAGAAQVRFILVGVGLILLLVYRPQGLLGNRREAIVGV
jgi:branched-chain amino acid transport system permease protein